MLILASITIGAVSGEGGLIGNANEAKEKTEIANEKEVVDRAVVEAMGKNKRGNLVRSELQDELDIITGEGETEVTIDEIDYGYFVKFLDSGRIYKVSRDGDVEYLGKEDDLLNQANIIANPESNTTPEFIQTVELTVETPIDIGDVDFMLVSAWSQDKNTAPADSEFQVATLQGDGRRRTTTVNSSASVEGDYYLWVRVVVGEIEKEECFGPYAIKDHTTLVATSSERTSESNFLGMPIERGLIQSVEIKNTLVGTGHSLGDGNTYDVTEGEKGKYLGWYEQNEKGYYNVTIAGEGGVIANIDSSYLFANIGSGITDEEVTITGLEYLDTGVVTNMTAMFGNSKVVELNVSSFNTENVTILRDTFGNCSNLTKLDLNNWNTRNVTILRDTFSNCSNLTKLDLNNWNTRNATSLFNTFSGCTNLTTLEISNWNTSNVTEMGESQGGWSYGGTFQNCTNLIELDLSKWNTSEVTGMGNMFNGCSSLTNLDLNNFDTSNVKSMYAMFKGCSKLQNLKIDQFETRNVLYMNYMFNRCSSLTELKLSSFDTSNVITMLNMFNGCSSLTELNLSNFDTSSVTNMEKMFYNCNNIINLDISRFDTSCVTTMNGMFELCRNLTKLDLSNFNTEKVTNMRSMFNECNNLTSLDLSKFNTDNVTIMNFMFQRCSSLTRLDISNFNTSDLTSWDYMFNDVSTTIEIITNTDTETWLREKFPNLTNIHQ